MMNARRNVTVTTLHGGLVARYNSIKQAMFDLGILVNEKNVEAIKTGKAFGYLWKYN